jgi:hypothetical protein
MSFIRKHLSLTITLLLDIYRELDAKEDDFVVLGDQLKAYQEEEGAGALAIVVADVYDPNSISLQNYSRLRGSYTLVCHILFYPIFLCYVIL